MAEQYIQVGMTAMREPGTGAFLPAVPLYVRREDMAEGAEEKLIADVSKLFAHRMKKYVDECDKAGITVQV